jgi:transcriptional regulator with XRE-family HTH domain
MSVATRAIPFAEAIDKLCEDPEFRAEWERTAPARAVANRLVAYRAEHSLSQSALARKLGISQPAVARLELGEHLPTLTTLARIARALEIEIAVDFLPPDQESSLLRPGLADGAEADPGGALLIAIR